MARNPAAIWRPLTPEDRTQPQIVPDQAIVHSAAVNVSSLYDYFMRTGVGIESHAFTKYDGSTEQYVDTSQSADANYLVNRRWNGSRFVGAISLETEDEGDPDTRPWTADQVEGIVQWFEWAITEHGIPRRVCRSWDDPGIGHHSQFRPWSKYVKTCPGVVRVRQWNETIVPRLLAGPSGGTVTAAANEKFKDVFVVAPGSLVTFDPVTGGKWTVAPDGAVFATHGAPYLGGYNAFPEWGAGDHPRACIGINPWVEKATGEVGYVLSFNDLTDYHFPRSGKYVKR